MEKKNVVIYVAGQRFSITTCDTEEYVKSIGDKVDVMIKGISKDNPKLNRDSCAILTALNFCDDETKLRQMMEVLREQVKEYINTNDALRTENCKLKEELAALKEASQKTAVEAKEIKEEITVKEITKEKPPAIPVPSKSEAVVAAALQQRNTAFVGKDFKSDKHKNKNNKHKNNQNFTKAPAPAAATVQSAEETDDSHDVSPYHQFSIFDDLP